MKKSQDSNTLFDVESIRKDFPILSRSRQWKALNLL